MVQTAKIVRDGNRYSVELPVKFHFSCDNVWVTREGNRIMLTPVIEEGRDPDATDFEVETTHGQ